MSKNAGRSASAHCRSSRRSVTRRSIYRWSLSQPPDDATKPAGGQELYAQKIQILGIRWAGRGPVWSWPGRMARRTPRKPLHALRALGFLKAFGRGPPFDDELGGRGVEVGVHDQGDVGEEAVAVLAFGERPGDGPSGYLGLAWPLRLGPLDRVDRGAVQREPRIAAQVRALAGVGHRAEDQFAVLEDRLDPGDPRRPVDPYGGNRLVPVSVEQRPHALGELRLCRLEIPPRCHEAHDRTGRLARGQGTPGLTAPGRRRLRPAGLQDRQVALGVETVLPLLVQEDQQALAHRPVAGRRP